MNIVRFAWRKIYCFIETNKLRKEIITKYHMHNKGNKIVIIGTPNHGNLGDVAIFLAEKKLLEEHKPECNVFDVNMAVFDKEIPILKKLLKPSDLLILTGGGNLGNQYMDDEIIRRKVISLFPHNRIVIFPQTMFFTNDLSGEIEKEITRQIYNSHSHLVIAARDEYSFVEMKKIFSSKIMLVPDVVLTWSNTEKMKREGALLVLRSDVESTLSIIQKEQLKQVLLRQFQKVEFTDTVVNDLIGISNFETELMKKLNQIQKAKLVVTDRLHGMIFAAITQTPCLVINNYNHKLRETYKWIQHLEYIDFLPDINSTEEKVNELMIKNSCYYDMINIKEIYKEFLKEIFNG